MFWLGLIAKALMLAYRFIKFFFLSWLCLFYLCFFTAIFGLRFLIITAFQISWISIYSFFVSLMLFFRFLGLLSIF